MQGMVEIDRKWERKEMKERKEVQGRIEIGNWRGRKERRCKEGAKKDRKR